MCHGKGVNGDSISMKEWGSLWIYKELISPRTEKNNEEMTEPWYFKSKKKKKS